MFVCFQKFVEAQVHKAIYTEVVISPITTERPVWSDVRHGAMWTNWLGCPGAPGGAWDPDVIQRGH